MSARASRRPVEHLAIVGVGEVIGGQRLEELHRPARVAGRRHQEVPLDDGLAAQ